MNIFRTGALSLAFLVLGSAFLSAAADEAARLPKPRPATEPPSDVVEWADGVASHFKTAGSGGTPEADAATAIERLAPLPRPRPEKSPALLTMVTPENGGLAPAPVRLASVVSEESDAELAACLSELRVLGVDFELLPPIDTDGACLIPHPLEVKGLGSGVRIEPKTILSCTATRALAEWMKAIVAPASLRSLGAGLEGIRQDSAYVCRTRYNDPHAKVSEHARANAIDIASFEFAGRKDVGVGSNDPGSPEARFESDVRSGACKYFTTVLGPGSNAAHATHFHFDLAKRKRGYRLCELGSPMIVRGPEKTTRE